MRTARPQGSPAAPLVFAGAMVAALIMGVAAISVAWADDSTDVSVEVIASSATPTATPTSTSSSTVGGASTTNPGTGTGVVTQPGTTQSGSNPSPTSPTSTDPGVAGVLYVSGLSWSYLPSLNPLDGSLTLRFTVRNVYSETLTPTASLWINQVFGGPVGVPVAVPVDTLKAGETRTVEATFTGLAQWTMLSAHATLALPSKGDQVDRKSVV